MLCGLVMVGMLINGPARGRRRQSCHRREPKVSYSTSATQELFNHQLSSKPAFVGQRHVVNENKALTRDCCDR
ncbi:hypothetical protein OBBRIDRAFT_401370 [Obba rivulosa]|uniref:Uncharacterized protein n=1 Tax=Obba rivulosa TaxID=1052685 RepID=A0A8E2DMH7_9APHY|nr:hypothetical protein OBBRIDRAFT_401370 [Obba rivulosa]